MITEHHIDLIQVSNSLDLKMTTGLLWGLLVYVIIYRNVLMNYRVGILSSSMKHPVLVVFRYYVRYSCMPVSHNNVWRSYTEIFILTRSRLRSIYGLI